MKNNIIVVIDINNKISENVINSHLHAAERWSCNYVIEHIQDKRFESCHPSWNKISLMLNNVFYKQYDRVLILDSDILIHIDSPNPFDINLSFDVGVVKDSHFQFINDPIKLADYTKKYLTPHYNYLTSYDSSISFSYIRNYFNSGVILYNPKIQEHIQDWYHSNLIRDSIPDGSAHREQAILNYILQKEVDITFLDNTWNMVDPDTENPMKGYFYHFTGKKWDYLKEKVKIYNWKI
jgi:lipopolysaccharide biosynthesis glycosyltransferase